LTGFLFHQGFTPALGVGIVACDSGGGAVCWYIERLAANGGGSMITAIVSLYLNVFVLIAQSFMKVL
jgi:hypothetical protein